MHARSRPPTVGAGNSHAVEALGTLGDERGLDAAAVGVVAAGLGQGAAARCCGGDGGRG